MGLFTRGPDYRVLHRRRWRWAEVETRWKNYHRHGHHTNAAFDVVEYLILLSAEKPPASALEALPPQIVHIDRAHFLSWYEEASEPELKGREFGTRVAIVAGAMQEHWTQICSDTDREMSICPDCDGCVYFGDGMFSEATPFFQNLAAEFLILTSLSKSGEADLGKVKPARLERFVEQHPPGSD
jgi:hypothetical protein